MSNRLGPRGKVVMALLLALLPLSAVVMPGSADAQVVASAAGRSAAAGHPTSPARRGVYRHISGLAWSSGVMPQDYSGQKALQFADRRGAAVDNVGVFVARNNWVAMLSGFWYSAIPSSFAPARDDLAVALPLWPSNRSVSNTGTRDQWVKLGGVIKAADPNAYLRLGWEMNIPAAAWSINKQNFNQWVYQWRRAARLLQVGCPRCRMVWNPNRGVDQSGVSSRAAFRKVENKVDVYAIDTYDIYPAIKDTASKREHMQGRGGLVDSYAFARKYGKKFAVPEWGISCNGPGCQWASNAGGDNPLFIKTYMGWFAQHAKHIAFETYYDSSAAKVRSSPFTKPIGPKAARAYRAAIQHYR